ncbi:MAG: hypothetical protein C0501_00195 [Isosphaera sp.]|nr:hypothetical protein [Isosphaera sp.]
MFPFVNTSDGSAGGSTMGMKPCPGCGMPREEKQLGKVPCPICSLSPPPPSVEPDEAGWGVDSGGPAAPQSDGIPTRTARPPRLPRRAGVGAGKKTWAAVAAGVLVLAGVGGAAFLLRGGTGQLLVTGGEDGVVVVVSRDGKDVVEVRPADNKPVELKPGTYEVAVKGPAGGWKVDGGSVTVSRGAAAVARVERGRAAAPGGAVPGGTAGAAPEIAPQAGAAEVSVTAAGTLTAAAFGRSHVFGGGTDYTVILPNPAGNAGRTVWVRMSPDLKGLVTLAGGGGAKIDGQPTRVMWAQEAAQLVTDGANWFKVAGKTRPMVCRIGRTAQLPGGVPNVAVTLVPGNIARTDNTGRMADTAAGVIRIRRPGLYQCTGSLNYAAADGESTMGPASDVHCRVHKNGEATTDVVALNAAASGVNWHPAIQATVARELTTSDDVRLYAYQASGTDVGIWAADNQDITWLSVVEIPQW